MRSSRRQLAVAAGLLIALSGCGGSAVASGSAAPISRTSTAPTSSVPTPSPEATGACPPGPASSPAPFSIGSEYGILSSEGGIDHAPPGLIALSDWEVTRNGACLADVLVFQFATDAEAVTFARDQADMVGLASGNVAGTTVWTNASGDGARMAIGTLALSVSMEDPDPAALLAMLTSMVRATSR